MLYEQLNKAREELQDFVEKLEQSSFVDEDDLQAWKSKLKDLERQCLGLQRLPEEVEAIENSIIDRLVKERAARRYDGD